jgi:preprotein translocase subunit YajC
MTISDVGSLFALGAIPEGGNAWVQFVPFAIVLAIFYFIILLPMKRKQQKVQQFLDALKVNDRIVTTGGIYGQVTRLGEQSVQIQIADKVRIEVAKAAIGGIQGQEPVQDPVGARDS